ncbi:MAG: AarF/ABC1/UbiB kinase family protein [Planctomycetes bacterium]|nr:AarF/ABC1/UbiB kinase family protein [Planctomycetota bacterium]
MKISSIPHIFRNVKRGTEIVAVLSRYGLADWLSHTNIDFAKDQLKNRDGEILARHTREARIRLALTDLGPTFIKLGQLLSTRPDLIGKELAAELQQLQSNVPADPADVVVRMVEEELGQPIEELFQEFDPVPLASASVGQVHRARLRSREEVVVKVQHHGIERIVQEDLDVISTLAQLAERIPELARYRPVQTAAEMARTLRRELDFGREERSLQQFNASFADNPSVRVPKPHTDFCTARILTMERLSGISLRDNTALLEQGYDPAQIARLGAELYLQMIFTQGFYHADPHPGNILVLPGNVIGLLDFGMVGRIEERLREDIEEMLLAIVQRDVVMLTTLIKRVGTVPPDLDEAAMRVDVADFVEQYATLSLRQFDVAGALNDMVEIIRKYHITLPSQVSLLIKTLVTLEGTTKALHPDFSLLEVMEPFHRKLMLRRLSPARQWRKLRRIYMEVEHLAEILPGRMLEILDQVQTGKFDVHLDHRGLGPSVNRLVLGMLASALFLGSSLLLSQKVPPLLFPDSENPFGLRDLSFLGLMGCTVAILVGLRLLRAIGKSGHLDRKD